MLTDQKQFYHGELSKIVVEKGTIDQIIKVLLM